jgi:hypothetical protein
MLWQTGREVLSQTVVNVKNFFLLHKINGRIKPELLSLAIQAQASLIFLSKAASYPMGEDKIALLANIRLT